ncbi:MAG: cbb3-type cytochrome c oxidase N-terminal domain-containing protein [Desulfurivibrio sp.]|nr:cbb3-type cytochrome c oxidase N-terminal domain-containing protein [Desulfurivibrio sp.]
MSEQHEAQAGAHTDGIREGHAPPPVYFNVLFAVLVIWALFFMGYFLLGDWSSSDKFEREMEAHQQRVENR